MCSVTSEPQNFRVGETFLLILVDEGVAVQKRHGRGIRRIHLRGDHLLGCVWPANIDLALLADPDREAREVVGIEPAQSQSRMPSIVVCALAQAA